MSVFTRKKLEELRSAGKIRDFKYPEEKSAAIGERRAEVVKINKPKLTKAFKKLASDLHYFCQEQGLHLLTEYEFNEHRKYRFDFAIVDKLPPDATLKLAIEYNGIMSKKSRHTTVTGYTGDMEKLNLAQGDGWIVLQYTVLNSKDVLQDIHKLIKK